MSKPGKTEPFQRDKLFVSIYESSKHRDNPAEVATELTNTVMGKLLNKIDQASLSRHQVIEITTEVLKHFDKASVVQYRAYHPL